MARKKQTPTPAKPLTLTLSIRWMIQRDMDDVMRIESCPDEFREFRWDLDVFKHHLRQRNVIGMVVENEDKIVGFQVYALTKTRLQLLNMVVDPRWRRIGVGRFMIDRNFSKLSNYRRNQIGVNVHEGNLGLQLFLRAMGFRSEGICGEFYIMVGRLPDTDPAPPNRIAAFLE